MAARGAKRLRTAAEDRGSLRPGRRLGSSDRQRGREEERRVEGERRVMVEDARPHAAAAGWGRGGGCHKAAAQLCPAGRPAPAAAGGRRASQLLTEAGMHWISTGSMSCVAPDWIWN